METKEEEAEVEPGEVIAGDSREYLSLKPSEVRHFSHSFVDGFGEGEQKRAAEGHVECGHDLQTATRSMYEMEVVSSGEPANTGSMGSEKDIRPACNESEEAAGKLEDFRTKRSCSAGEEGDSPLITNDPGGMVGEHRALKQQTHLLRKYKVENDEPFSGSCVCENEVLDVLYYSNGGRANFEAASSDADSASTTKCANSEHSSTEKVDTETVKKEIIENDFYKRWYQHFFPRKRASSQALYLYTLRERRLAERRSRENEAVLDASDPVLFISKRGTAIKFDELDWSENERAAFKNAFETFGKNFAVISKLTNRDIKECITFYYRTKRTNEYRKKVGRYSDEQLKLVIESEWSPFEIKMYSQCLKLYKGNILKFAGLFPNKDLKMFRRYYKKFHEEMKVHESDDAGNVAVGQTECSFLNESGVKRVRKRKENRRNKTQEKDMAEGSCRKEQCTEKDVSESAGDVLREWTMDERQLFAIYYPHFNKNWVKFAEYIKTKRISDFSRYFRFYFKKLTRNERNFETYQCELEKDKHRNLFVGRKTIKRFQGDDYISTAGLLFRPCQ